MCPRIKNRVWDKYNKLTVIKFAGISLQGRALWECLCECGNIKIVSWTNLVTNMTQSCSSTCTQTWRSNVRHWMTKTPIFRSWRAMKQRCYDSYTNWFHRYWWRGIQVCPQWLNSFDQFYKDMWPRPTWTTLDRIDNDGNYEPWNCRWATPTVQNRNQKWVTRKSIDKHFPNQLNS